MTRAGSAGALLPRWRWSEMTAGFSRKPPVPVSVQERIFPHRLGCCDKGGRSGMIADSCLCASDPSRFPVFAGEVAWHGIQ